MDTPCITVAFGDGFGPAVMESVLSILREAAANITVETIEIGKRIYDMDSDTGILPSAWKVLEKNRVLLKAPVLVPEDDKYRETGEVIRQHMDLDESHKLDFIDDFNNIPTARAFICEHFVLFEPIYEDSVWEQKPAIIDPSPMLHAAILMLNHIGQQKTAILIHNAWLLAIEDGCLLKERKRLSRMTEAVIERLGKAPRNTILTVPSYTRMTSVN